MRRLILFFTCLCLSSSAFATSPYRITQISLDDGGFSGFLVDLKQDQCGTTEEPQPEQFSETFVKFKIRNDSSQIISLTSIKFTIPKVLGRSRANSHRISLLGEVLPKSEGDLSALMLKAIDGNKTIDGFNETFALTTGARNVSFTIYGRLSSGKSVRLNAKTAIVFRAVNRC